MKKYLSVLMLVSCVSVHSMDQSHEEVVRSALVRGIANCRDLQAKRGTVLVTTDGNVGQFRHRPTPRSITPPLDDQSGGRALQAKPWQSSRVRRVESAPLGFFWAQLQKLPQWQRGVVRCVLIGGSGILVGKIVDKLCQMVPEGIRLYCGCGSFAEYAQMFGW